MEHIGYPEIQGKSNLLASLIFSFSNRVIAKISQLSTRINRNDQYTEIIIFSVVLMYSVQYSVK